MSASASVTSGKLDALRPRTADGWGVGVALALAAHVLLLAVLFLGMRTSEKEPEPIEAEVWSELPAVAALAAAPQPVVTAPQPTPEPAPPPTPEPAKVAEPVPEPIPDVAVAQLSKAERKKAKKHKEPVEVFDSTPPKPSKKAVKPEKPPAKVIAKASDKAPPPKASAKADKALADSAQANADREAQRRANLARITGQLGGNAPQSSGPSAAYGGRIKARIKPNIVFASSVGGNPEASVEVRCAPDGRIMSHRLLKSSGVPAWDEAVLRAVERSEVLPPDENGRVPPVMVLDFKPNDF